MCIKTLDTLNKKSYYILVRKIRKEKKERQEVMNHEKRTRTRTKIL